MTPAAGGNPPASKGNTGTAGGIKSKRSDPILKRFTSKFRHISSSMMHRSLHFTNLKKISISTLSESDGFHVNKKWMAVPLSGAGGNIAILDVSTSISLCLIVYLSILMLNGINGVSGYGGLFLRLQCIYPNDFAILCIAAVCGDLQ